MINHLFWQITIEIVHSRICNITRKIEIFANLQLNQQSTNTLNIQLYVCSRYIIILSNFCTDSAYDGSGRYSLEFSLLRRYPSVEASLRSFVNENSLWKEISVRLSTKVSKHLSELAIVEMMVDYWYTKERGLFLANRTKNTFLPPSSQVQILGKRCFPIICFCHTMSPKGDWIFTHYRDRTDYNLQFTYFVFISTLS